MTELIATGQKQLLEGIQQTRSCVNQTLTDLEKVVTGFYTSMSEQVKLKANKSCEDIKQIFEQIRTAATPDELLHQVQKVISLMPRGDESQQPVQESDLIEAITAVSSELNDQVRKLCDEFKQKSTASLERLNKTITDTDIWTSVKYKFSPKLKHAEINVLSPALVKSVGASSYKFAVMEPDVERSGGQIKRLAFRIKEASMNWLAVGVCHKNLVQSKNFSFSFNVLGHGGYMVSSNGGSWSDTKS